MTLVKEWNLEKIEERWKQKERIGTVEMANQIEWLISLVKKLEEVIKKYRNMICGCQIEDDKIISWCQFHKRWKDEAEAHVKKLEKENDELQKTINALTPIVRVIGEEK